MLYGTSGVGYQSVLMSAGSLTALFATWGIANSLPVLVPLRRSSGAGDFNNAIFKGVGLAFPISIVVIAAIMLPTLSPPYSWPVATVGLVLSALAAVMAAVRPVMLSVYSGARMAARNQVVAAIVTAMVTVCTVWLVPEALLPIVVGAGLFLGQAVGWLATRSTSAQAPDRSRSRVPVKWLIRESWHVYYTSAMSAVVLAFLPLIVFWNAGSDTAGLLKSALSLGGMTVGVLVSTVSLHYYPRIGQLLGEEEATTSLTITSARSVMRLAVPATALVAVASPLLLLLAYTREFLAAAGALAFIAAAGLPKLLTFHNAYLLLAQRRRSAYLAAEMLGSAILAVLVTIASALETVSLIGAAVWLTYWAHYWITSMMLRKDADKGAMLGHMPGSIRLFIWLPPAAAFGWAWVELSTDWL